MEALGLGLRGRWIGETQGCDSLAHIWDITVQGLLVRIETRWEGEERAERMTGRLQITPPGFALGDVRAMLIDPQHFWIPGWDTPDTRGGQGPAYDVVFSRPGLAELTAQEAYRKALAAHQAAEG